MDELLDIQTRFTESEIDYYADLSSIRLDGIRRRNHTKDLIELFGPYRFFITVSFNLDLSNRKTHEYGGKFARRLTKKVVHKRWQAKELQPLTGIVILETAVVIRNSRRKIGGWHLHFLVHDHPSLPRDDGEALKIMTDAYWKSAERLWLRGVNRKGRKPKDVQLVTKTRPDRNEKDREKAIEDAEKEDQKKVQLVTGIKGLCEYLSKEVWKPGWDWAERLFFLGSEGMQSEPDSSHGTGASSITSSEAAHRDSAADQATDSRQSFLAD